MFKFEPEDFIVEEIAANGDLLEIDKPYSRQDEKLQSSNHFFSVFALQKRLWTTSNATRQIADRLYINSGRINFAGNKDRNALTVQLCSAFAIQPRQLLALNIKDIKINGAWLSNGKVKLGGLSGNRFTITLTEENIGSTDFRKLSAEKIEMKLKRQNYCIPNYFGDQRFGSARKNTAIVGKLLVQGKFKEAILNYLCHTDEGEKDEQASKARKLLEKSMNFHEAMRTFPYFLKHERYMLSHLTQSPNDYLGAFRKLHRSLQLLFIHAYQSELFNKILEARIKKGKLLKPALGDYYCGMNDLGFPDVEQHKKIESKAQQKMVNGLISEKRAVILGKLVGFQTELSKDEEKLLGREKVKKEEFVMKSTPELNSKGTYRPNFAFLKDFACAEQKEGGKRGIRLRFALPSGSYATVALKEIIS